MMTSGLMVADIAPIENVTRERALAMISRIKLAVNDPLLTDNMAMIIAQESILYRTMPQVDIHYYVNKRTRKLERIFDYKYLVNITEAREFLREGRRVKIIYDERIMTPEEKMVHGVGENDFAIAVTVSTDLDRDAYRREVAEWLKLDGISIEQAMDAARRVMGDQAGTTAVGVVSKGDENIPTGWSPLQKAAKLARKNAIHKRWGTPTVDEMRAYARHMTREGTQEQDWAEIPLELPQEIQARYASMAAGIREANERDVDMTPEEHRERLAGNVVVLRGEKDDSAIGEEPDREPKTDNQITQEFCAKVAAEIPYFNHANHVANTLKKLGLEYDPWNEGDILKALNGYASQKADELQVDMFDGQPDIDEALGRNNQYAAGA